MCGRYTLTDPVAATRDLFGLDAPADWAPRYNIAPTQQALVARVDPEGDRTELVAMRWGFQPPQPGVPRRPDPINARAESVRGRPLFRDSFRERRCAVPASGFLEWTKGPGSSKQPHHIVMSDGTPFAMAGLWTPWMDSDGVQVGCFTVITTAANDVVSPLHDRMPAILPREDIARWLDPGIRDVDQLSSLLRPYQAGGMRHDPVDPRVNSPAFDEAAALEVVAPMAQGELF